MRDALRKAAEARIRETQDQFAGSQSDPQSRGTGNTARALDWQASQPERANAAQTAAIH